MTPVVSARFWPLLCPALAAFTRPMRLLNHKTQLSTCSLFTNTYGYCLASVPLMFSAFDSVSVLTSISQLYAGCTLCRYVVTSLPVRSL